MYAVTRSEKWAGRAHFILVAGLLFHLLSLIVRTVIGRQMPNHDWYFPWSNWFESFSFLAFVILSVYIVIQWKREVPILGVFITPLAWICLITAVHSPTGMAIPSLPPVLQSFWMCLHVSLMFFAYAGFGNAFGVGLAYLIQERQLKSRKPSLLVFRLPALDDLDTLIYRIVLWSLPALMIGLAVGMRWAYLEWGRYWDWDPKETWAFITWMVYLDYLFMRWVIGWRGRKATYLSMIGFVVALFTYVGVNYFSHLHDFLSAGGH
jgi:cytochrome c-type biogenesis protein CcsB